MNIRVLSYLTVVALLACSPTPRPSAAVPIATVEEAGHFYALARTADGHGLRLLIDTGGGGGGGMYWITAAAAKRLGLQTRVCVVEGDSISVATVPEFTAGWKLPPPIPSRSPCGNTLIVLQGQDYPGADGQLGAGYLPGRIWTFDYPGHRVALEAASWRPPEAAHATGLGFQRNAQGQITSGFARITIRVDGEALDLLLDTGATAHPTAAGALASRTPTVAGTGVTSYITHSVFERWHSRHPDWRVVQAGDDLFGAERPTRIIEVPAVGVAGWSVGPVWFTERADANFHTFMGRWMDKRPEGALGGNVFRHFVMTVDYPGAEAYFQCVYGCVRGG